MEAPVYLHVHQAQVDNNIYLELFFLPRFRPVITVFLDYFKTICFHIFTTLHEQTRTQYSGRNDTFCLRISPTLQKQYMPAAKSNISFKQPSFKIVK